MKPDDGSDKPDPLGSLVSASVSGDPGARDALARWCLPRVRRTVLMSCGPGPDADDLVQTVMTKVISRMDTFRGEARFYIWVDRITINVVRDHYRRRRWNLFQPYDEDWEAHQPARDDRPDAEVARNRLLERVAWHLDKMSPKLRLPLVLHLLHGYSAPETAAILELSFEATKKRLLRGRRKLIDRLRADPQCKGFLMEMGR